MVLAHLGDRVRKQLHILLHGRLKLDILLIWWLDLAISISLQRSMRIPVNRQLMRVDPISNYIGVHLHLFSQRIGLSSGFLLLNFTEWDRSLRILIIWVFLLSLTVILHKLPMQFLSFPLKSLLFPEVFHLPSLLLSCFTCLFLFHLGSQLRFVNILVMLSSSWVNVCLRVLYEWRERAGASGVTVRSHSIMRQTERIVMQAPPRSSFL